MKNLIIAFLLILGAQTSYAQTPSPVKWSFSSRKKADKVYEVVLSANFANPWHMYSQFTPDGGPLPTKVSFGLNPLLEIGQSTREVGKLQTKHDGTFDVDVRYFSDKVEFITTVKLKNPAVKTNVRGTVEYMVCNDTKCLPPVKQSFDIKLL